MKVYIVCHRYVDLNKGLISSYIKRVYTNREQALDFLDSKEEKGDYNWYLVTKQIVGKEHEDV